MLHFIYIAYGSEAKGEGMGIVKISDELHEEARIISKAMSRSINAQAEHWMRIGQIIEANPQMTYVQACEYLCEQARQSEAPSEHSLRDAG